jgi:hypothetical protein
VAASRPTYAIPTPVIKEITMNVKEILGLIIRVFALLLAGYGLYHMFYAVIEQAGLVPYSTIPAPRHALFGAFYFAIAIVIVRTADHIANFAYKKTNHPATDRKDGEALGE